MVECIVKILSPSDSPNIPSATNQHNVIASGSPLKGALNTGWYIINKKAYLTPVKRATAVYVWRLVFAISTLFDTP